MKNQLQIFRNPEFGEVRTQVDEKGEPWFCAKDVCDTLGYKAGRNAIAQHVDEGDALKQCTLQQDIRLNNPPQAIRLYGEDNDKLVLEISITWRSHKST